MTEVHKSTIFILGILLAVLSLSGCGDAGEDFLYSQSLAKSSFTGGFTTGDLAHDYDDHGLTHYDYEDNLTHGYGDEDLTPSDGDEDPTPSDGDEDPTLSDGDEDPTTGDCDGDKDPTPSDGDEDLTPSDGDEDTTPGENWDNSSDECPYEDFSYGDPKTIGFWKHQVKGILSDKSFIQVEPEDVEACLPLGLFGMLFEDVQELNDALWLKDASMKERAIQQCIASTLNLCYGELCDGSLVYAIGDDGVLDSFADAMAFAATAFSVGEYEMAKDVCDTINNL